MVAVAQSVERQVVVLDVAGSNPVGHPSREWLPVLLGSGAPHGEIAPLAQRQSNGLLIRRFWVRIPGGAPHHRSSDAAGSSQARPRPIGTSTGRCDARTTCCPVLICPVLICPVSGSTVPGCSSTRSPGADRPQRTSPKPDALLIAGLPTPHGPTTGDDIMDAHAGGAQRSTVTLRNVAGMMVRWGETLVFWAVNRSSSSAWSSVALLLDSAAAKAFMVGP